MKGFVLSVCLLALAAAAPARAAEPAAKFNAPGQTHANVCASLTGSSAPLRYADASPTGFSVTNAFSFADGRCPSGTVRLDLHELIPSSAGPLAFHRGGNGYANDQNVKYGELAVSALAGALPAPVRSGGGRGAPCAVASGPPWQVDVRSIPSAMKYKRPQDVPSGNNSGSSFMHYGDPGSDQGDRHDIHYSYLVWSFVNVRGGGMVRTLLRQGQVVEPCDVEPVTMQSWDRQGNVNGSVTARYVRTHAGSCPLYGWMVWTHSYLGGAPVAHVKPSTASGGGAEAAPDCPAAAAAAPPTVVTGDGAFSGSVNPEGVPTTYRFEYEGGATAEGALGSSVASVAVSAPLPEGLVPGTTYHYRLVATNSHGTSYGEYREYATPAPPPPAAVETPPPPPPPPPAPPALRSLKVAPKSFRRGRAARIVWSLTRPATVTLTFERWNGRRWKRVRGYLRTTRPSIRFRGFMGKRRMARGRYRLTATPRGGGRPRHARFTLR